MEQQTISIAKAGITTVLNSRTSVCAAANPAFGRYRCVVASASVVDCSSDADDRYDDMRTADENIEFASTILSRFDMIYIVRDIQNEERDARLAEHVLKVHMGIASAQDELQVPRLVLVCCD